MRNYTPVSAVPQTAFPTSIGNCVLENCNPVSVHILSSGSDPDAAETKLCTVFLFQAFLRKYRFPARDWMSSWSMRAARLVVWQQGDTTFTIDAEGVPVNALGETVRLTGDDIVLAHPMELSPGTVQAWQDYFAARHLTQPFIQMEEPVFDPHEIHPDRCEKYPVAERLLFNQDKHGITNVNNIKWKLADCEARDVLLMIKTEDGSGENEWAIEFRNFRFETYTRAVNHIVAFLEHCTVRDRIRRGSDDIPARGCLHGFSLSEILELIDLAVQNHCVNASAALQQYKQERFGDAFPADKFELLS